MSERLVLRGIVIIIIIIIQSLSFFSPVQQQQQKQRLPNDNFGRNSVSLRNRFLD